MPPAAFADADAASTTFRALAWSEAHDVPPLVPAVEPYDERDPAPTGLSGARPQFEFDAAEAPAVAGMPWYRRRSSWLGVAASVVLLLGTSAVVAFGSDSTPRRAPRRCRRRPRGGTRCGGRTAGESSAQPQQDLPPRTVYAVPAPATEYQAPAPQQVVCAPPQAASTSAGGTRTEFRGAAPAAGRDHHRGDIPRRKRRPSTTP